MSPSNTFQQQPEPSKWSWGRILSLLILVGTVLSAIGGVLGFFHLNSAEWFLHAAAFLATITERAQGGAGALAAKIIKGEVTRVESVDGSHVVNITTDQRSTEPFGNQQFR